MSQYLEVAIAAARVAGELQRQAYHGTLVVRETSRHDIKLQTDVDCEEAIRGIIARAYPDHALLGEEGGGTLPAAQPVWIIDPLDGTVNFSRRLPHFCTSIALQMQGRVVAAVVYDPLLDELFTAEEGAGAYLNGTRLQVSDTAELCAANMAIGFAKSQETIARGLGKLTELAHAVSKIRIMGAAALDLAYVAAGRFDGFIEYGLRTWDIAAGTLLIREAGGHVLLSPRGELSWDVWADNGRIW